MSRGPWPRPVGPAPASPAAGTLKAPPASWEFVPPSETSASEERASDLRVEAAMLECPNCGRPTPHRILRVDRTSAPRRGRVRGIARCRNCRLTHPFASAPAERADVELIVSDGAVSERSRLPLPRLARLTVGATVPVAGDPLTVRRLDGPDGRSVRSARAAELRTIWAVRDRGTVVAVSIVEGRRTRSASLALPHGTLLGIGDALSVDDRPHAIVALRANGHTWKRLGDRFRAEEVGRAYVRRTDRPPAGRSAWSRGRVSPSSRASATSVGSRSRSSPGTSTTRRRPRARSAAGGAADQSSSPS